MNDIHTRTRYGHEQTKPRFTFGLRAFAIACTVVGGMLGIVGKEGNQLRRKVDQDEQVIILGRKLGAQVSKSDGKRPWYLFWVREKRLFRHVYRVSFGPAFPRSDAPVRTGLTGRLQRLHEAMAESKVFSYDISHTDISDEDLRSLAGVSDLRHLLATSSGVRGDGLLVLKQLRTLSLGGPRIDDHSLACVSQLESLRTLNVYSANVTAEGLESIAHTAELRELSMQGCDGVTDDGVAHLSDSRLKVLRLGHSSITDNSVESLGQIQSLELLEVTSTYISEEGYERLRELLPKTTISWKRRWSLGAWREGKHSLAIANPEKGITEEDQQATEQTEW